jgi:O-antigen biosynthesis protein WbqP
MLGAGNRLPVESMKQFLDLSLACLATTLLLVLPLLLLACLVKLSSPGPGIYWYDRVGRHNRIFEIPKFRTMLIHTPAVATHLLDNAGNYLTTISGFLRKTNLDELPQLWSIWRGNMSSIGSRPVFSIRMI